MGQSPSSELNSRSAAQEISCVLFNSIVRYCVHISPSKISFNVDVRTFQSVLAACGLHDLNIRLRFPTGTNIFLFSTATRTAVWPTQPPIEWVPAGYLGA
jgi:hypothetical protein